MLLGLVTGKSYALRARSKFNFEDIETMIFTSIVCWGELLALAEKRAWGQTKRRLLKEFLDKIPAVDINQESILNSYALIDAWSQGKPVDYPKENPFPPPKPAAVTLTDLLERCKSVVRGPCSALTNSGIGIHSCEL